MFELSVACKYLLPRRRQLSVSIISLISILVISLVVWLIVVFFSVTDGLEKSWIHKLTALTAPVRLTPTDAYYNSYYYQVDSISQASNFQNKTIRKKHDALLADSYDPTEDQEIPLHWPQPDRLATGEVKDLVKLAYASINELKGVSNVQAQDFEVTASHLTLNLVRDLENSKASHRISSSSSIAFPAFVGNFEPNNLALTKALLNPNESDLNNILYTLGQLPNPSEQLNNFLNNISVKQLKTASNGWKIPHSLLPSQAHWEVITISKGEKLGQIIIPSDVNKINMLLANYDDNPELTVIRAKLRIENRKFILEIPEKPPQLLSNRSVLTLAGDTLLSAQQIPFETPLKNLDELFYQITTQIQGITIEGRVPFRGLEIAKADIHSTLTNPLWVHANQAGETLDLPYHTALGHGILLPKNMKNNGVRVGDRGHISYMVPTASILQDQQLPVYVAGFYDQGIIPIGGKFILATRDLIDVVRPALQPEEKANTNGINIHFSPFQNSEEVKAQLIDSLKKNGINRYWDVETYKEYEFTKNIIQELQSQKNIFSLIAVVIIIVACSNIISMLIILVNDKKMEIGILRSMGASSKSIALIFGLAGGVIGIMGSLIGVLAAVLTLKNLNVLIALISRLQGYDLFNSAFYGERMPQEISYEALSFVIIATIFTSLLAGIVPAVKACLVRPSSILRSTG